MPIINLIHENITARRKEASQRRLWMGGVAGIAVLGGLAFGTLFLQTEVLASEKRALNAKIQEMEPQLNLIASTQEQYNQLSPKLETLQQAGVATKTWNRVLDHISRSCPENVWLTAMRCSQAQEDLPIRMDVQGLGPSQESISELILNLQACLDLENVSLQYTQPDEFDDKAMIKFEVSGDLKGTAKEKPKPKEEEEKSSE